MRRLIRSHSEFSWGRMGDIEQGRPSLGPDMLVKMYRAMRFSLQSVLNEDLGEKKALEMFAQAGHLAGYEMAMVHLQLDQNLESFLGEIQTAMKNLKIGILAVEKLDSNTGEMTLSVENDLECCGLSAPRRASCGYNAGLLTGIMKAYSGNEYHFVETDCWSEDRIICRFSGRLVLQRYPINGTQGNVE